MKEERRNNTTKIKATDLKEIKEFLELVKQADITELIWEKDGTRISFKRGVSDREEGKEDLAKETQVASDSSQITTPKPDIAQLSETKKEGVSVFPERYTTIKSRMVGTFYRALSSDQPPLVKVRDIIKPGQKVCVIEAMKIMREISADKGGRVVKILVEDGQPVEYGQDMFLIDPFYEVEEGKGTKTE